MRPGESDAFLTLKPSRAPGDVTAKLSRAVWSLSFRACHCSVFEECWLSNLQDFRPGRVSACPTNDRSFNENPAPR